MYSKEDLILKAVGTQQRRVEQYCHLSRENVMKVIRNMPPSLTMEQLRRAWYEGRDGAHDHYKLVTLLRPQPSFRILPRDGGMAQL